MRTLIPWRGNWKPVNGSSSARCSTSKHQLLPATRIEKLVSRWFRVYGEFVAKNPLPFLLVPILLTLALGSGFLFLREDNDVRKLYIPSNAVSRQELKTIEEYQKKKSYFYSLSTLFKRTDSGNLLNNNTMSVILRFSNFIENNLTIVYNNSEWNLKRLQGRFPSNIEWPSTHIRLFTKLYFNPSYRNLSGVHLTYPVMQAFGKSLFLPHFFHGVETYNDRIIKSISYVNLVYRLDQDIATTSYDDDGAEEILNKIGRRFGDRLDIFSREFNQAKQGIQSKTDNNDTEDPLQLLVFHTDSISIAIQENGMETMPKLALSFLLLLAFTVLSSLTSNPVTSKPWEAAAGVLCTLMAISSTFGLMFLLGYPSAGVVVMMPFLILSIGVDDVFILLEAWHRTSATLPIPKRLAEAVAEAGTSITITSLTDVVSFGIGACSQTPAVSLFCLFTAVAVFVDFVFQESFFLAIVTISGRREIKGEPFYICCYYGFGQNKTKNNLQQAAPDVVQDTIISKHEWYQKVRSILQIAQRVVGVRKFFDEYVGFYLNRAYFRILVTLAVVLHLCVAIYGCATIRTNLSPSKMVSESSPSMELLRIFETHMLSEGFLASVLISSAPDIRNASAVNRLLTAVSELESLQFSAGNGSTIFWLRNYLSYLEHVSINNTRATLEAWLALTGYRSLSNQVLFTDIQSGSSNKYGTIMNNNNGSFIEQTMFYTGFAGLANWQSRIELVRAWRNLSATYADLNLTVFEDDNLYVDESLAMPDTVMQDAGTGILCMCLIAFLFISSVHSVYWVCTAMLSIMAGVIGYLSLWGADLDPITVITITMCVGFSIDFTCHVEYAMCVCDAATPEDRVQQTLYNMGWSTTQCSIATVLGVIALLSIRSYMIQVFLLTVVLVAVLGILHALVVLPILLSAFVNYDKRTSSTTCKS